MDPNPDLTEQTGFSGIETGGITTSLPDDGLNLRQRKFADHYLEGHFAKHAAVLAGYSEDNAARIATRLLKTPAIAAYLTTERDRLCGEAFYSRRLLVDWLWKVIHTSADDIQEGDNIIQELTTRETADGTRTRRIKMVNKLAALRQLARMLGFDKPELTLPGNLARSFQAFIPANSGVAPSPTTLHAMGHSPRPLPGRDRSPNGPVDAAHPTLPDQGPENLPSSRRRRPEPGPLLAPVCCQSTQPHPPEVPHTAPLQAGTVIPNGPVGAAHPTLPDQGPDHRLPSSHSSPDYQGLHPHPSPQNNHSKCTPPETPHTTPNNPIPDHNLPSTPVLPAGSTRQPANPHFLPDFPPYEPVSRKKSPTVISPIPL